jgi:hypothetical protein
MNYIFKNKIYKKIFLFLYLISANELNAQEQLLRHEEPKTSSYIHFVMEKLALQFRQLLRDDGGWALRNWVTQQSAKESDDKYKKLERIARALVWAEINYIVMHKILDETIRVGYDYKYKFDLPQNALAEIQKILSFGPVSYDNIPLVGYNDIKDYLIKAYKIYAIITNSGKKLFPYSLIMGFVKYFYPSVQDDILWNPDFQTLNAKANSLGKKAGTVTWQDFEKLLEPFALISRYYNWHQDDEIRDAKIIGQKLAGNNLVR